MLTLLRAHPNLTAAGTRFLRGKAYGVLLLLLFSQTFFLWMFIASAALERMADAGQISLSQAVDTREVAYAFAAKWRHGMAPGWLLYMPGFFATAIVTWIWSHPRTVRRLLTEGVSVVVLATIGALLLAPPGAAMVLEAFQLETGLVFTGAIPGPSLIAAGLGIYTLISWSVFIIASQRAIAIRSFRPLWLPLFLAIGLALARPVTVGDFAGFWARHVLQGDPVAILSVLFAVIAGAFLVLYQLRRARYARGTNSTD